MFDRQRILTYVTLFLVFLLLAGCSSSDTTQSGLTSQSGQAGGRGQPGTRESTTGPGSLEAKQRGRDPSTPEASPLREIYFDFDRYELRSDARATLKENAEWLKANASVRVEIEGHCDERGTNEYNLALGAKRAQAAKDYLASLGIAAARLSTISYGEELAVCKEQSEDCWQRNRRDRFVVITARPAS